MNKLIDIIGNMSMTDLINVKRDLDEGNLHRIIERKISSLTPPGKECPVCGESIKEQNFTLLFGNKGVRMKASFDAVDCLEHFINKLKKKQI